MSMSKWMPGFTRTRVRLRRTGRSAASAHTHGKSRDGLKIHSEWIRVGTLARQTGRMRVPPSHRDGRSGAAAFGQPFLLHGWPGQPPVVWGATPQEVSE